MPTPAPVAWFPLLSSIIKFLRSMQGIALHVGVPTTKSSTYSFAPVGPCETSLMTSCCANCVLPKKSKTKNKRYNFNLIIKNFILKWFRINKRAFELPVGFSLL